MELPFNKVDKEEINIREKIAFELGIKLGSIFHQFIGTPVSKENRKNLEKSIEKSIENQPYVKNAKIKINLEKIDEYTSLSPDQLKATVIVEIENKIGIGKLEYIENYPLMWIDGLKEKN